MGLEARWGSLDMTQCSLESDCPQASRQEEADFFFRLWWPGCHSEELALPLCFMDMGESLGVELRLCLLKIWHTVGQ